LEAFCYDENMDKTFYVGSYKNDAQNEVDVHNGWIIGTFMEESPRKNDKVEIKYWSYLKGANQGHDTKKSSIIECTFVLTGAVKGVIDGEEIIFRAGDYVVIQPETPNNMIIDVLEDTTGLTVKAPSDPSAKKVLD
jgi:quercetin dioxygenase-like cupin family protein